MTDAGSFPLRDRRYRRGLLILVLAGLALRVFFFTLTIGSDDQRWVLAARQLFGDRPFDLPAEYYARILWRLVLWAWGLPWGLSLESTVPLMFLLFLVTTFAIARVARMCFGSEAALVAVAVFVTHPLNVLYDTRALPDGLGVAMLAVALLLFIDHLHSARLVSLGAAGVLIGLTISVKEYFVLLGVPCMAALALRYRTHRSWRPLLTFGLAIAFAVGVDVALHAVDAEPLAHWRAQAAYGDRLLARHAESGSVGVRLIAAIAAERSLYVRALLFEEPGAGVLILWGLLVLAVKARRDVAAAILLCATALFVAFLSLMPAKMHPLIFVEMQERYLTVVLPFGSIAAGAGMTSVLRALQSASERRAAVIGLIILLAANVIVADSAWNGYRTVEFAGIRQVLATARSRGIGELLLPENYAGLIPDRYYRYGACVVFVKFSDWQSAERLRRYLEQGRDRAVLVPRGGGEDWRPQPLHGDTFGQFAVGDAAAVVAALRETDFVSEEITAPYTAWRSWLAIAGVRTRGQTVGWLYRLREEPKDRATSLKMSPSPILPHPS